MFIPYDYTEAELSFTGCREDLIKIEDYWDSIGNPKYNKDISFNGNMLEMYNNLRYWPKPIFNNKIVQTIILEYEYDNKRTG